MTSSFRRHAHRLAHPRSRRSRLWACVYCGAFDADAASEPSKDRPDGR